MSRVIRKIDIKGDRVKATRSLEGLRDVGDLKHALLHHEETFQSEVFLNNYTATLFETGPMQSSLLREIRLVSSYPLIVGGGISSIQIASSLFDAGADRITVNTAALTNPELLSQLIQAFGAQAIILSLHCRLVDSEYRLFTKMGREIVDTKLVPQLREVASVDGLEVLVTSISTEGTGRGFPPDLAKQVCETLDPLRVILCGGMSTMEDMNTLAASNIGVSFAAATFFRAKDE